MADEGLMLVRATFNMGRGQQTHTLPPKARCCHADLVGRSIRTVWACDLSEKPQQRTFQLLYLPAGESFTKAVSPQWEVVKVVDDGVGGFIALLVLQ